MGVCCRTPFLTDSLRVITSSVTMYSPVLLLLLAAAGCLASPESISIDSSQVGEREPFFFFTLTLTVTSTLSTATTFTSLSSTTACAGKRRRRAILMGDEEYF